MSSKKLSIHLADSSLELLAIIAGSHGDDINLTLSSAVNLCIQQCMPTRPLNLTANELLFCCDILNGGAQMTEFKTPDSVSVTSALDSMLFSLIDAAENNYGGELEKWGIALPKTFSERLESLRGDQSALFTLALATRHFWSDGKKLAGFKNLGECADYIEWAGQWVQ
jgi:hypothetical protein